MKKVLAIVAVASLFTLGFTAVEKTQDISAPKCYDCTGWKLI